MHQANAQISEEIRQVLIVASLLFVFFAGFIILIFILYSKKHNKHLSQIETMQQAFAQQLLQSQIETQEETMGMLGKELHDNVAQLLSSTKMLIGITERGMANPPDTLIIADDTLSKAIYELRTLSKSLSKEWLQQFNFIENLTAEAARINTSKKVTLQFTHPKTLPLEADKQIILFRIVQEAIQNTLKHAKASTISILVSEAINTLHVIIEDDGKGFKTEDTKNGMGIMNIKHRTCLLGGNVTWTSNESGTKIFIELPIKKEELL